jgi:ribonuclease R
MKFELEEVSRVLQRARGKGSSLKQIGEELEAGKGERLKLRRILAEMIEAGRAVFADGAYRLVQQGGGQKVQPAAPRAQQPAPKGQQSAPRASQQQRTPQPREPQPRPPREQPPREREPQPSPRASQPPPRASQPPPPRAPAPQASRSQPPPAGKRKLPAAMTEGTRQRRLAQVGRPEAQHEPRGKKYDRAPAPRKKGETTRVGGEIVGVLHLKSEGYGFVSPLVPTGGGREGDLFIPPQHTGGALDGDVVNVRAVKGRDGRLAGEVTEVVERRRQLALGTYQSRGSPSSAGGAWVIPLDRNLTGNIAVPRDPKAHDGEMVKVRLDRDKPGPLSGQIIGVLGPRGDPRFEILASAYAAGFSDEFDPATLLAAQSVPDRVLPEDLQARRDLRHLPLVTIDGEDARDFDDAVHVSRAGTGYRLVVAIADVAHYVRPGGSLDREALRRGTSVYFPGTVIPMLPERLSNGICSLNPDVDRLCMVCDMALDANGKPLQADIYDAVMRSHARLTYTKVAAALEGAPPPDVKPLMEDLTIAGELAKKLTAQRKVRGAIDFDLPEAKILLDDDGHIKEIARRPRNDAHKLVEEFMLAANEAVARFFDVRGLPTVYRIHDAPDEEKLEAFAALARIHGFDVPAGKEMTPSVLNKFLEQVEGKPQQKALNSLLLRAMMQAQYSPDNIGHYGLAAPTYLHFTSPIRRYPDLIVHRLLKEHWARGGQTLRAHERDEQEAVLAGVAAQCSERERASMKAERDIDAYYMAMFMQDKIGNRYKAVVAGVADFGLFCEMEEIFVEGLVPAEDLGDGVELDKERHRLVVGKSGKSFGVGDRLEIEVVSADPARRRITLRIATGAQQSAPSSKSGPVSMQPWFTPEDLTPAAGSPKRRLPQRAQQQRPGQRPPPRGSSPGQKSPRGRKPGRGR